MKGKRELQFGIQPIKKTYNLDPGHYNPKHFFTPQYKAKLKHSHSFGSKQKKGLFLNMFLGDIGLSESQELKYVASLEPGPGSYKIEKFSDFSKIEKKLGNVKNKGKKWYRKGYSFGGDKLRYDLTLNKNYNIGPGSYELTRGEGWHKPSFNKKKDFFSSSKTEKKEKSNENYLYRIKDYIKKESKRQTAHLKRSMIREKKVQKLKKDMLKIKLKQKLAKIKKKNRNPTLPGPGTYDLKRSKTVEKCAPFKSKVKRDMFDFEDNDIPPVGQYSIDEDTIEKRMKNKQKLDNWVNRPFGENSPRFKKKKEKIGDVRKKDGIIEAAREIFGYNVDDMKKVMPLGEKELGAGSGYQFSREVTKQFLIFRKGDMNG